MISALRRLPAWLGRFARDEDGVMTVQNLFLTLACCATGAAGVDVTYFFSARTELQVAADIAAHSALVRRNTGATTAAQAKSDAIARVQYGMPAATFGTVINAADITFGTYDPATRTFTSDANSRSAVRAVTTRDQADGNPVGSFLFRVVGIRQMDVRAQAIAMTYSPGCLNGGFVAQGIVDIQSNNAYYKGFCIHSNTHVEMNQNNTFESGTVVSMPSLSSLVIPDSGLQKNTGLEQALRESSYDLRILDRVRAGASDPLDTAISTLGTEDTPWYVTSATKLSLTGTSLSPSSFTAGRVHTVTCNGGQTLTMAGGTYSQFVLLTNCAIKFSGQANLEDVVISTTNTASDSIQTPSNKTDALVIGKNDGCAPRGGAELITRGGVKAAAKLTFYDGQIVALGNVQFAAQGLGVGASIIAGGTIDSTSNMDFQLCPSPPVENFTVPYFRLAL